MRKKILKAFSKRLLLYEDTCKETTDGKSDNCQAPTECRTFKKKIRTQRSVDSVVGKF